MQEYFAATKLPLVLAIVLWLVPFAVIATNLSVGAAKSFECKDIVQQQNCLLFWQ